MSHKAQEILFVTNDGSVMTNGFSNKLSKGVLGVADKGSPSTKDGLVITDTLPTTPVDRKFELRLGIADTTVSRNRSNKSWSSLPFKLSDVVEVKASAPSLVHKVDEVWIGYDGINADSAITLKNGETAVIDITLEGDGLGVLGYPHSKTTLKFYITAPYEGEFSMQEIIETAIFKLKNTKLYGNVPVTEFLEISAINSENQALTGNEHTIYELVLPIAGNSNNVGLVKAQYPDLDIKFEGEINGISKFITSVSGEDAPEPFNVETTNIVLDCGEYDSSTTTATTVAWTAGETCNATTRVLTLQLPDEECGGNRLAELQAAYPDLTITAGASTNCQTVYSTTVTTDFVCENCSPIIRDLFDFEMPAPYDFVNWKLAPQNFSETALMGIRIKGKQFIVAGGEEYRDSLPFFHSFVKISVSGGYPFSRYINFEDTVSDIKDSYYKVTWISRGSRPEALGMDYMDEEEKTRVYYTLQKRLQDNLFGNAMLGNESLLKPLAQYVMYSIHIRRVTLSQSFTQELVEHVRYNILAEVGKHKKVEALVNKIATASGLPTVQTYEGK